MIERHFASRSPRDDQILVIDFGPVDARPRRAYHPWAVRTPTPSARPWCY